jgi:NADH-quinone oxidoreductase subunit H
MPYYVDKYIYILAPLLTFFIILLSWVVIPFGISSKLAEIDYGIFYLLAISSTSVYGVLLSGWSSNSKYAFLGALRSAAQMVSYEISVAIIISTLVLCVGSFNISEIVRYQANTIWFVFPFFPLFFLFFICGVAETNRHPFDLPEAEAELVSGYNVEYSGMKFALFSLGEYSNILLMSALTSILFFGGWDAPNVFFGSLCFPIFSIITYIFGNILHFSTFSIITSLPLEIWLSIKIGIFVVIFILLRAGLPRFRYDQLMELGWKTVLPLSLFYFMFVCCCLWILNVFPI